MGRGVDGLPSTPTPSCIFICGGRRLGWAGHHINLLPLILYHLQQGGVAGVLCLCLCNLSRLVGWDRGWHRSHLGGPPTVHLLHLVCHRISHLWVTGVSHSIEPLCIVWHWRCAVHDWWHRVCCHSLVRRCWCRRLPRLLSWAFRRVPLVAESASVTIAASSCLLPVPAIVA